MKKQKHLRAESERKGKVTSIRLTEEQHERVQKKAQEKGMTVSNYIITTAVNGGNAITPEMLVKMQNLANMACDAVKGFAPDKAESIQKGMNDIIWQKLM